MLDRRGEQQSSEPEDQLHRMRLGCGDGPVAPLADGVERRSSSAAIRSRPLDLGLDLELTSA